MAGARLASARMRRALAGLVACVALAPAAGGLIVPANAPTGPRVSPHRFWALDFSAGAGSISAPYIAEHIVSNVTDAAVTWEKVGSDVASRLPRWLLLSIIGVVTRELTSREVRETLVPALITSGEAQPKAKLLTSKLRRSLDTRVSKVLLFILFILLLLLLLFIARHARVEGHRGRGLHIRYLRRGA